MSAVGQRTLQVDIEWVAVLFTDDSWFCVNFQDRREKDWHSPGEENVVQHDSFGRSSFMVWGVIVIGGRTQLVIIKNGSLTDQRYGDEILRPFARLYAGAMWPDFMLMDDNTHPHQARLVTKFLEEGI